MKIRKLKNAVMSLIAIIIRVSLLTYGIVILANLQNEDNEDSG